MLALIQARFSSHRLPGKVLMDLDNQSVLERTIKQVKKSNYISSIAVATSNDKSDDPVTYVAKKCNCLVFRGDLTDVGKRLLHAAQSMGANFFLRISADSPLIDWRVIDEALTIFKKFNPDLVTNIFPRTFPKGQSVEVINSQTLNQVCDYKRSLDQKEHVTSYFYDNFCDFKIINFTSGQNSSSSIHCIDTAFDFEIAAQVVQQIGNKDLTWQELEIISSKVRNQI